MFVWQIQDDLLASTVVFDCPKPRVAGAIAPRPVAKAGRCERWTLESIRGFEEEKPCRGYKGAMLFESLYLKTSKKHPFETLGWFCFSG